MTCAPLPIKSGCQKVIGCLLLFSFRHRRGMRLLTFETVALCKLRKANFRDRRLEPTQKQPSKILSASRNYFHFMTSQSENSLKVPEKRSSSKCPDGDNRFFKS